jgi:hypothetical protein
VKDILERCKVVFYCLRNCAVLMMFINTQHISILNGHLQVTLKNIKNYWNSYLHASQSLLNIAKLGFTGFSL